MIALPAPLWPIVAGLRGASWPPRGPDALDAFFDTARRENLLPLLLDADGLPEEVQAHRARYRAMAALHRRAHAMRLAATRELVRLAGDDILFYKGADYRYRLYAQPQHRPMQDLDIYVPPDRFDAVLQRLQDGGHELRHSCFGAAFRPGHYEISVQVGAVHVEVHRSFAQPTRAAIDYAGIWARRERFEAEGVAAWRPAPADAVLCHAWNLTIDEFSSPLVRLLDFQRLLQRHPDSLRECVQRAREWRMQRALFGALHVVATLFPDDLPAAAFAARDALLDSATRRHLAGRVLPDRRVETGVVARRRQLWRKFNLIDQPWRRAWFVLHQSYALSSGWWHEWRARQAGAVFPSRASLR